MTMKPTIMGAKQRFVDRFNHDLGIERFSRDERLRTSDQSSVKLNTEFSRLDFYFVHTVNLTMSLTRL